jgi:diguanylate cyclase (GGDEF)-like protein
VKRRARNADFEDQTHISNEHVRVFARRRVSGTVERRVPLVFSFAAVSLILTLALGVVLGREIERSVNERGLEMLRQTTQSAIALTVNTIVTGLSFGTEGVPTTTQQKLAQADLISSASRVLVSNSDVVAVEAVLADGTIIGGAGAPPVGVTIPRDERFRAALAGVLQIRTLDMNAHSATGIEPSLLGRFGDLLVLEQGVRIKPGGPILAVVVSYAPLGPTRRQAAADSRSIILILAAGLLVLWLAVFRLVVRASRALRREASRNAYQATHDALTALPNRVLLRDRTKQAVLASRRSGTYVALILIGLNRFRELNDTLGHPLGDVLLKQIGPRLQEHLRESDTVGRLGGDEFAVILADLRSPETALTVAEKLNVAIQQSFVLDGVTVDVDSSAGIATSPDHGETFDELLQHADIAMDVAKREKLATVNYTAELDTYSADQLTLLADLRQAVEQPGQIVVFYQPQAELATGKVSGVEALVRWQHPQNGLISPDDFIPLAEHTGIIRPLTWLILRAALTQNRQWAQAGLLLRVSVNVSPRCLLEPEFADNVSRLLAEIGVPPERLEVELTETAIMNDPDHARDVLHDLAGRGIRLSIDDFGTGYSSMAYLKMLPVHELKIDRAFIENMDSDANDAAIVQYSLDLARNLKVTVVAEGVATQAVWQLLAELGCPTAQGYYLSRPMPADNLVQWIAHHQTTVAASTTPVTRAATTST